MLLTVLIVLVTIEDIKGQSCPPEHFDPRWIVLKSRPCYSDDTWRDCRGYILDWREAWHGKEGYSPRCIEELTVWYGGTGKCSYSDKSCPGYLSKRVRPDTDWLKQEEYQPMIIGMARKLCSNSRHVYLKRKWKGQSEAKTNHFDLLDVEGHDWWDCPAATTPTTTTTTTTWRPQPPTTSTPSRPGPGPVTTTTSTWRPGPVTSTTTTTRRPGPTRPPLTPTPPPPITSSTTPSSTGNQSDAPTTTKEEDEALLTIPNILSVVWCLIIIIAVVDIIRLCRSPLSKDKDEDGDFEDDDEYDEEDEEYED